MLLFFYDVAATSMCGYRLSNFQWFPWAASFVFASIPNISSVWLVVACGSDDGAKDRLNTHIFFFVRFLLIFVVYPLFIRITFSIRQCVSRMRDFLFVPFLSFVFLSFSLFIQWNVLYFLAFCLCTEAFGIGHTLWRKPTVRISRFKCMFFVLFSVWKNGRK